MWQSSDFRAGSYQSIEAHSFVLRYVDPELPNIYDPSSGEELSRILDESTTEIKLNSEKDVSPPREE